MLVPQQTEVLRACPASSGCRPSSMRISARLRRLSRRLLQQVDGAIQLGIKVAAQDFEDFDQGAIPDRVIDLVAHLPADHDLFGPKYGQMLRGVGLLDTELFDQLSSRSLPLAKEFYDCT